MINAIRSSCYVGGIFMLIGLLLLGLTSGRVQELGAFALLIGMIFMVNTVILMIYDMFC